MLNQVLASWIIAAAFIGGCGGSDAPIGTVEQNVSPCEQGLPAFDVWRADFAPNVRQTISGFVDTRDDGTAAEFRLTVACEGKVVAETISGVLCTYDAPKVKDGPDPECPSFSIDVDDIDFNGRIECLAEIGTTESLRIGTGGCADPEIARYGLRMSVGTDPLALDLVADDCRDRDSCLEADFGIDVD
jgi:hypothetical protein